MTACKITINSSFAGTPTANGASVTVSGTVNSPATQPCTLLRVSMKCLPGGATSSGNTKPDAKGNWAITLPVTCTCNNSIAVVVECAGPAGVTCANDAHGPIVCGGGTGGVKNDCHPSVQLLGLIIQISCPLVLFIMSVSWGIALGLLLFNLCLYPFYINSIGGAVATIWIVAAGVALIATWLYLQFCQKCLCWFWLFVWRFLWLAGLIAAGFNQKVCGATCAVTSLIGVALMIFAVLALFIWQGVCLKTVCDAAYEGVLYIVFVFFTICVPLWLIFLACSWSLTSIGWGGIVLLITFLLFAAIFVFSNCSPKFPPPEWDF
jgi:hypothetical protein